MFAVTVAFRIKQAAVEDFRKAVFQQAKNSLKKEKGCKRFDVCVNDNDPQSIFLYELYVDSAAFDQHCQTAHFKAFREASEPMLEDRAVKFWRLAPAG